MQNVTIERINDVFPNFNDSTALSPTACKFEMYPEISFRIACNKLSLQEDFNPI